MMAFLPLLTQLLPGVAGILAGDKSGGGALERMIEEIKKLTAKQTEAEAKAVLDANPQMKVEMQSKLAELALEELKEQNRAHEEQQRLELELTQLEADERERVRQAEFQAYVRDLQDRQEARAGYTKLAEDRNPLAWVPPIIAILLVVLIFYLLRGIMVAREPVINKDVFNVVLGALVTAFTTVISFYFGSSMGSRTKDEALKEGTLVPKQPMPDDGKGPAFPGPSYPGDPDPRVPGPKAPPGPVPTGPLGLFQHKSPIVMRDLMKDLSLSAVQAAGILGNIGVECAAFRKMQEEGQLSGRGGWGWCQWTGPRRRAFEAWAEGKQLGRATDEANYGFLLEELRGPEAASLTRLRQARTLEAATTVFMSSFERPGVPALNNRIRFANLALQEYMRTSNG